MVGGEGFLCDLLLTCYSSECGDFKIFLANLTTMYIMVERYVCKFSLCRYTKIRNYSNCALSEKFMSIEFLITQ